MKRGRARRKREEPYYMPRTPSLGSLKTKYTTFARQPRCGLDPSQFGNNTVNIQPGWLLANGSKKSLATF
jgi:hypothetical protein